MGPFALSVKLAIVFAALSVSALPAQEAATNGAVAPGKAALMPPLPKMPPVTSESAATKSFESVFKKLAPEDQAKSQSPNDIVAEMPPVPAVAKQALVETDIPSPPIAGPFEQERKQIEKMTDSAIEGKVTTDKIIDQTIKDAKQPAGTVRAAAAAEGEAIAKKNAEKTETHPTSSAATAASTAGGAVAETAAQAAAVAPAGAEPKAKETKASATPNTHKTSSVAKIAAQVEKSGNAQEKALVHEAQGVENMAKAQEDANKNNAINANGTPHPLAASPQPAGHLHSAQSTQNSAASSAHGVTFMTVGLTAMAAIILGSL
jgi:hypothetical protein